MGAIHSMTGWGTAALDLGGRRWAVDVRTVNHRYLDLKVVLPRPLAAHEPVVVEAVKGRLHRGRVEATVRLAGAAAAPAGAGDAAGGAPRVEVDLPLARAVHRALEELRATLGIAVPVGLELVAGQREVLVVADDAGAGDDTAAERLRAATEQALDRVVAMRATEGRALERDLRDALREARAASAGIVEAAKGRVEEHHGRLRDRLARLTAAVGAAPVDEARIAHELVMIADRLDVSEELARLASHFGQLDELLGGSGPAGRKADFLAQEMAREANTIGAKSQDAELTRRVVELKAALERLREQLQNVE